MYYNLKRRRVPSDKLARRTLFADQCHRGASTRQTIDSIDSAMMRNFVCATLLLFGAAVVCGKPANNNKNNNKEEQIHFDQRQNGTENYRLNIDGVLLAVAPAETVLSAVNSADLTQLLDMIEFTDDYQPVLVASSSSSSSTVKPQEGAAASPGGAAAAPAPAAPAAPAGDKKETKGASGEAKPKMGLKKRLASILLPLLRRNRNE